MSASRPTILPPVLSNPIIFPPALSRRPISPEPSRLLPDTGFPVKSRSQLTTQGLKLLMAQYAGTLRQWFIRQGFPKKTIESAKFIIRGYAPGITDAILQNLTLDELNYVGYLLGELSITNPKELETINRYPDTLAEILQNEIKHIAAEFQTNDNTEDEYGDEYDETDDDQWAHSGEDLVLDDDGLVRYISQSRSSQSANVDTTKRTQILQQIATLKEIIASLEAQL